ncbi:hypothetical protein VYU27_006624 [Nannochloropsis oceanica]
MRQAMVALAITEDKDDLPLHYSLPLSSSPVMKHASIPSLDALAVLGLLALAGLLSNELLERLSHSPLADSTLPYPSTAHLYPYFSILAPITEIPGSSVTLYVLPNWASIGVMVPGLDALTVHALTDLSPAAAMTGERLLKLLQVSRDLAWVLPFLVLCAVMGFEARRRTKKLLGNSKDSLILVSSVTAALRVILGAAICLLGILLPFLALHRLPRSLAEDLTLNPTDHPLLKGLSPQEVVYRFVHWEDPDFIDDPGAVTIVRAESSVVPVAALGLVWVGLGLRLLLPLLLPLCQSTPWGKRQR